MTSGAVRQCGHGRWATLPRHRREGVRGYVERRNEQHDYCSADGGCAMVDAAGWLARTSDYDCTPIELTVGTTLLLEADDGSAALVPVVVHSITEAVLPAGSVLYNPYLSSGWSMRGNGVLLSEPSRQHNRQWYTNPARHAAQLSVTERASIYAQSVSSSSTEGSSNAPLYAVQDQLWQSHAVAVELKISSQPVQMRSATAAGLLQQLEAIVDSWVQPSPAGASARVGCAQRENRFHPSCDVLHASACVCALYPMPGYTASILYGKQTATGDTEGIRTVRWCVIPRSIHGLVPTFTRD